MKEKKAALDSDMAGACAALIRAGAKARQLAIQTGTPFYVLQDGKIVNLNPQPSDSLVLREGGKTK